jgi:predicted permease
MVLRKFPAPLGFSAELFAEARIAPNLRPLKQDVVGDVGKVLWVLMGTIGMVLLIACANVANLLLVRAEGRQQELAVKAALGASRSRIASELLLESLRLGEIGVDTPVLLFTLAISLLAGALFGSIPVFKHAGARFASALRSSGRGLSQSRERHRARSALVVVQVALALVLLISSGLMIRTFQALRNVQPGFVRPSEVQTLSISIPEAQVRDREQVARMQEAMLRKVAEIPGVVSAALSSSIPMDGGGSWDPVFAQDRTYSEREIPPTRRFKFVSPGLPRTLGTPLVAGRDFTWTDVDEKRPVALVSENMAREYWGGPAAALGKRIRVGPSDEWREVVGVAADVRDDGVNQKAPAIVYWPMLMKKFWGNDILVRRTLAIAIRSRRTGSEGLLREVRQAVWSVNADLPVADVRTLDEIYRKSMARTSFTLVMLGIAGAMALLLGVVGIYGVIAYSVSQRTREIGVRMALGARRQELAGMFVWEGLRLAGAGVFCGLIAAAGLTRLMTSLLFEVSPADPVTYGAVSAGLAATAALASYVPSRRAAGVDPAEALRGE